MITIIDYDIGNVGSIVNALSKLGIPNQVSNNPYEIGKSQGLILPGVGAAGQGMKNLKKLNLDKVIIEEIKNRKSILGICLGMQLLFEESEEGNISCLGVFNGKVKKYRKEKRIPQIGWNEIRMKQFNLPCRQAANLTEQQLMNNIPDKSYFYFVNSFYCEPADQSIVVSTTDYGEKFASIVCKDNIVATQFHPEKSGKIGFQLLKNWSELC